MNRLLNAQTHTDAQKFLRAAARKRTLDKENGLNYANVPEAETNEKTDDIKRSTQTPDTSLAQSVLSSRGLMDYPSYGGSQTSMSTRSSMVESTPGSPSKSSSEGEDSEDSEEDEDD